MMSEFRNDLPPAMIDKCVKAALIVRVVASDLGKSEITIADVVRAQTIAALRATALPELLEALQTILDAYDLDLNELPAAIELARIAMAKVTR